MTPPADRIHSDPGQGARKVPSDTADLDFQAVGPVLRILQLNVEGLSTAKRSIIQTLAERHHAYDNNNNNNKLGTGTLSLLTRLLIVSQFMLSWNVNGEF